MIFPYFGVLVAQTDPSGGWGDIVGVYGPFAPFALLVLYLLNLLWKDNKEKELQIRTYTDTTINRLVPLITETSSALSDAIDILKNASEVNKSVTKLALIADELTDQIEDVKKQIALLKQASGSNPYTEEDELMVRRNKADDALGLLTDGLDELEVKIKELRSIVETIKEEDSDGTNGGQPGAVAAV